MTLLRHSIKDLTGTLKSRENLPDSILKAGAINIICYNVKNVIPFSPSLCQGLMYKTSAGNLWIPPDSMKPTVVLS